jgi:hypothetical protein
VNVEVLAYSPVLDEWMVLSPEKGAEPAQRDDHGAVPRRVLLPTARPAHRGTRSHDAKWTIARSPQTAPRAASMLAALL